MTDAVWIALINNIAPVLSLCLSFVVLIVQIVTKRQVTKSTKKIETKVEQEAQGIKAAAVVSDEKLAMMRTDAHWAGVMERDKLELKRNTDFGKLPPPDWRG